MLRSDNDTEVRFDIMSRLLIVLRQHVCGISLAQNMQQRNRLLKNHPLMGNSGAWHYTLIKFVRYL